MRAAGETSPAAPGIHAGKSRPGGRGPAAAPGPPYGRYRTNL